MTFAPAARRGARPGSRTSSTAENPQVAVTSPPPPLGDLLWMICSKDMEESAGEFREAASIRDSTMIASFNWSRGNSPTIVIPGSPPRLSPPTNSSQLRQDKGDFYRDRNAAQYPSHPIEPTIVAGLHCNPSLAKDISIVACSSTMGNLLRFVRGQEKSFRILAEVVDESLFLVRRENFLPR